MTRSGFVAMIFASGLALGQLAALPAAADETAARQKALEPYFRNYRPSGAGPFPAILMVSGCSGFTPSIAPQVYTRAAESWRSKGYVVVFVDYLSARGLPNCRGSGAVNAVEIGRDLLAVARYLQGQPYVKASQISAVGWSLGGGAVLAALGQLTAAENSPLRAVVAYYPYCRDLQPWQAKVPALSLMGARDEVAPPEICQRVFAQLPPGTALQARIYPEARHGFDVSDLPPYAKFGPEIVGYNAAADAAAVREVEQFMSRKTD